MNQPSNSTSTFVVVPAYNEATIIRSALEGLLQLNLSVVVVDDGSSDGTEALVADLPIYFLRHSINLGQGAAIQTGTSFALSQGARIVIHFDADGQHSATDIAALTEPLHQGKADVVLGSRFLRPADIKAVPFARRWLLRCAKACNWLMTGIRLTDAHNGLRALSREAAARIVLRENGFAHATEILGEINYLKLRYTERPTSVIYTNYSKTKGQSSWNAFKILMDIFLGRLSR